MSTTLERATDKLSVTLYPKDVLDANTSFTLYVRSHWEIKDGTTWRFVNWKGQKASEDLVHEFSTGLPEIELESENIKTLYPIPNQYHFLMNESPNCMIELIRGQASMFESPSHTFVAIFKASSGPAIEKAVTYDKIKRTVLFNTTGELQTETIYKLSIVARQAATDHVMLEYHFRTSKYKTFTEKYNTITFAGNAVTILIAPWRGHYLHQIISTAGEYFDSFETETKFENVTVLGNGQSNVAVPYGSNLVRFEAVMNMSNTLYASLYPLIYAPWTDPNFKPTASRDTARVI